MNSEYSITFRLPKKYAALAGEYLFESGEKNFNALAQKLLVAEIEKRGSKDENSTSEFDGKNTEFLLAALGNLRELFRRAFELLFDAENPKGRYENIAKEMQDDWSAIIEMFLRRTSAVDVSFEDFAADVETRINEIFDIKLIEPATKNFASAAVVEPKKNSPEILKQGSLFD